MLLNGVDQYFTGLPEMNFISKVFCSMSAFQAPYKAVLVSLYESAVQSGNEPLKMKIREVFDLQIDDMPERFKELGLDDSLVMPSNVVNTSFLMDKIRKSEEDSPELNYHKENEEFLKNIMKEIHVVMRKNK